VAPKRDGTYRVQQRGESNHTRELVEGVARELLRGDLLLEKGRARLVETRKEVERGWFAVGDILMAHSQEQLAKQVWRFATAMAPPMTERERIGEDLRRQVREARSRGHPAHLPMSR
jgi:hypothetical protein